MNYKDKMKQAMASIQAQGQGVCQFQIVFRQALPELFRAANSGDEMALHTLVMLRQALVDMSKGRQPYACCAITNFPNRRRRPPLSCFLPPSMPALLDCQPAVSSLRRTAAAE